MTKIIDKIIGIYLFFYLSFFITDYSFIFPKHPVSNISGPTGVFLLLLFLRWFVDKKGFSKSPFLKKIEGIDNINNAKFMFFAGSIIFFAFLVLGIVRHLALSSSAFDLGIFDQAVWNASHGNGLYSSLRQMDLMGDHFEPILFFIVPFYKLWPSVNVLFILQSLLLASAIIPLYLIAKANFKEKIIIYAFIISYALSRPLRGIVLSDFHPECFILPLLFWAYYLLLKRKDTLFFLTVFLLLLCKEDVTILISVLGIFSYFSQKRRVLGISLFIGGIILWFIETKIFIPYFNPTGIFSYKNRLPFGAAYQDNLYAVFLNPIFLIKSLFSQPKMLYCLKLLGPVGFLPFLSPSHYILIVIPLFKNLLPTDINFSGWYNITSHYTASLIPFIYIAAIYGAKKLISKIKQQQTILPVAAFIIVCSLFFYGKTDANKISRFLKTIRQESTLDKIAYLKSIPTQASIATNFNLVPHVSERKYVFIWNPQSKSSYNAEYLVIDLKRLDYLAQCALDMVGPYLKNIEKSGYLKVFESKDKSFLIFYKQNFSEKLLRNL